MIPDKLDLQRNHYNLKKKKVADDREVACEHALIGHRKGNGGLEGIIISSVSLNSNNYFVYMTVMVTHGVFAAHFSIPVSYLRNGLSYQFTLTLEMSSSVSESHQDWLSLSH